jgi:hypothetical protein
MRGCARVGQNLFSAMLHLSFPVTDSRHTDYPQAIHVETVFLALRLLTPGFWLLLRVICGSFHLFCDLFLFKSGGFDRFY